MNESIYNAPAYNAAKDRYFRAECKLRCLTAALDRTDPEDFDALFEQIKAARSEERRAWTELINVQLSAAREGKQ